MTIRKRKATRKPDRREAFNVEHMSKIREWADAYLDGRINIAGASINIHELVQRIVKHHVEA